MKFINSFVVAVLAFTQLALAEPVPQETQREASKIMKSFEDVDDPADRAIAISAHFFGREFAWGPCGEGVDGSFEPKPLTRFDKFDCTTYVEAVLGLSFANPQGDFEDFIGTFKTIKYCDANNVCYPNRNHFPSLNWIPNVIEKGYLIDVTTEILPDAPERMKWLDVEGWYQQKIDDLQKKEEDTTDAQRELGLESPNKDASNLARLHYIPLSQMLSDEVQTKLSDERIVVFNMVRNEHTKRNMPVIVGHQGFIVQKDGQLFIRHAASTRKVVEDVSLDEYVKERMKDTTWPTLGFNILSFDAESEPN